MAKATEGEQGRLPPVSTNRLGLLPHPRQGGAARYLVGGHLSRHLRRKNPSACSFTDLLAITFRSLATLYLLLGCCRQLNDGLGVGAAPRALADEDGSPTTAYSGGPNWSAQGRPAAEEGGGREERPQTDFQMAVEVDWTTGEPTAQQPVIAVLEPSAVAPADGLTAWERTRGEANGWRSPLAARQNVSQTDKLDMAGAMAEGWGFRMMPVKARHTVQVWFRRLERIGIICSQGVLLLDPGNACQLVRLLTSLAALELSAFSLVPADLEEDRQYVVQRYLDLLSKTLNMTETQEIGDDVQETRKQLVELVQLLTELRKGRHIRADLNALTYMKKMLTQFRLFQVASGHTTTVLRVLFPPEGSSRAHLSGQLLRQQLSILQALFDVRLQQILSDGTLRWSLVQSHLAVGYSVLYTQDEPRLAKRQRGIPNMSEQVTAIDKAVEQAGGRLFHPPIALGTLAPGVFAVDDPQRVHGDMNSEEQPAPRHLTSIRESSSLCPGVLLATWPAEADTIPEPSLSTSSSSTYRGHAPCEGPVIFPPGIPLPRGHQMAMVRPSPVPEPWMAPRQDSASPGLVSTGSDFPAYSAHQHVQEDAPASVFAAANDEELDPVLARIITYGPTWDDIPDCEDNDKEDPRSEAALRPERSCPFDDRCHHS